ncbi:MAG: hypothetical protein K6T65_05565 [Peptococcaceae bacterium]|nr:hypothetical protein [Peptococcaceae bacterium]
MSGMAEVLFIPEVLRSKLGEEGTKELISLINQATKSMRENVSETSAERLERRMAEMKTDIVKEVAGVESRLTWKLVAFWVGQTAFIMAILGFAAKAFLR